MRSSRSRSLHLAVRDHHAHLGHDSREHLLYGADRAHAVVEEEDLAAASDLAQDGLTDQALLRSDRPGYGSPDGPPAASRSRKGRGCR